jgi:hypothetical protein
MYHSNRWSHGMRTVNAESINELSLWIKALDLTRQSDSTLPDLGDALQYAIHTKDCDAIHIVCWRHSMRSVSLCHCVTVSRCLSVSLFRYFTVLGD